jgi:hypothetical protein
MSAEEARPEETVSQSLQIFRLSTMGKNWGEYLGPDPSVRIARNVGEYLELARVERFCAADAVALGPSP